jgi:coenzyme F420-0:L-glutamate ligase/coenzyme F420-1:gamma-L-glutamate ligase
VTGLGEVREGADLAALLAAALAPLAPCEGDVLCVSTKIVSKALGLRVSPEDRDAAIERASVRTVARRLHTRPVTSVVQIPSGPVMAAAGVDSSNAPDGPLLLPEDPDACARELREGLVARLGVGVGVVLTDTSSRIWRVGVSDIALGAAGVRALEDLRGGVDADGRALTVTVRNLADELAAAADLVKGKASRIPAALVRGVPGATGADVPARELSRTGGEDWFRRPSLESVWVALGLSPAQEPIARMSPEPAAERIVRALEVAAIPRAGEAPFIARARRVGDGGADIVVEPAGLSPAALVDAATLAERLRTALGAESLAEPLPPVSVEIVPPAPPAGTVDPVDPTDPEDPR